MNLNKLVFITGTNTDIGKTAASLYIIRAFLNDNPELKLCYVKPIQTGCELVNNKLILPDLEYIKNELKDKIDYKYFYAFKYPAAPYYASLKETKTIDINYMEHQISDLRNEFDYIIVEGAGGLQVPITYEYMYSDFINDIHPDKLVLVTSTQLGTLNHTLLSVEYIKSKLSINPYILFNHLEPLSELSEENIKYLKNYPNLVTAGVIGYNFKNNIIDIKKLK